MSLEGPTSQRKEESRDGGERGRERNFPEPKV